MTKTQDILRNFLSLSLGGALLACQGPLEDGEHCFNINEGETCPSEDEVNENDMPYEPTCETIEYQEVTGPPVQSDDPISYGMEVEAGDGDSCCYPATYREVRSKPDCVIGRPLIEEGTAKIASTSRSPNSPWRTKLRTMVPSQTREQRTIAGQFYLQTALYEHASIASFQKFGLELMRFGAPPHLLRGAQEAALDEIRHAQLSFELATQLLGYEVQPSNLDYTPNLANSIHELAEATLHEGAIGETIAVLLAAEQLRHATDPAVRFYLQQVIDDESKHAELAWETIRWCLQQDPSIKSIILKAIEDGYEGSLSHYPTTAIHSLGLPNRQHLKETIKRGFTSVILPSLFSLLEQNAA